MVSRSSSDQRFTCGVASELRFSFFAEILQIVCGHLQTFFFDCVGKECGNSAEISQNFSDKFL